MKSLWFSLALLFLPLWATAQWSLQAFAGGGFAYESASEVYQNHNSGLEQPQLPYADYGYAFQAGIQVQYFINTTFGLESGLGYLYNRSSGYISMPPPQGTHWHSESLKIPFNFLWSPGKRHHAVFHVGLSTHFNLMPRYEVTYDYRSNYQYPVFTSAQLGYSYKLGERSQLTIEFEKDLGWYARSSYYETHITVLDPRSFTTLQLLYSYRLFANHER